MKESELACPNLLKQTLVPWIADRQDIPVTFQEKTRITIMYMLFQLRNHNIV